MFLLVNNNPLGCYMTIIKLSSTIPLSLLLLTACSSNIESSNDEEAVAEETVVEDPAISADNPCLAQWAIQSMKDKIVESALENIETNYSSDTMDTSSLYDANIGFSYITKATELENGGWGCSAQVDITYIGNDKSDSGLSVQVAKMMNANYLTFSNMGISPYNINQFREIKGNSFSVPIEYEIKTTYSESGEEQQSYEASIGNASAMLAVIAVVDDRSQRSKASSARYAEQELARSEAAAAATRAYEEQDYNTPDSSSENDNYQDVEDAIETLDIADEVVVVEEYSEY